MHRPLLVFVLIPLSISPIGISAQNSAPRSLQLTVGVYNDAGVSPVILKRAEQRAADIFARASFEVVWLHCLHAGPADAVACHQTDLPQHVVLRIIRNPVSPGKDSVFGVAFLSVDGTGKYSDVFWNRVRDLQATSNLDLASVLGSVMAHEMGHLLLGSNAHSVSGIMRAQWEAEELQRIAMGTLLFTEQQAEGMRGRASLAELAERKVPITSKYEASIDRSLALVRR